MGLLDSMGVILPQVLDRLTESERAELIALIEISGNLGAGDRQIRERICELVDKRNGATAYRWMKRWDD